MASMGWEFTQKPNEAGWYAVLICYDEREGVFPAPGYWNGMEWGRNHVVGWWPEKCDSSELAEEMAYENDPDK